MILRFYHLLLDCTNWWWCLYQSTNHPVQLWAARTFNDAMHTALFGRNIWLRTGQAEALTPVLSLASRLDGSRFDRAFRPSLGETLCRVVYRQGHIPSKRAARPALSMRVALTLSVPRVTEVWLPDSQAVSSCGEPWIIQNVGSQTVPRKNNKYFSRGENKRACHARKFEGYLTNWLADVSLGIGLLLIC